MTIMAMTIAPKSKIQKAKAKPGKAVLEHAVRATMVHVPRATTVKVAPNDLVADREMMAMVMAKVAHVLVLAHEMMTTVKAAPARVPAHEMMATGMVKADLGDPTAMTTLAHPVEGGPVVAIETTATAMAIAMKADGTEIVMKVAAMKVAVMMASEKAVGDPTITEVVPIVDEAADAQVVVTVVEATITADVAETIIAADATVAATTRTMAVAIMAIAAITPIATIPVAEIGIPRTTTIQLILMKRI